LNFEQTYCTQSSNQAQTLFCFAERRPRAGFAPPRPHPKAVGGAAGWHCSRIASPQHRVAAQNAGDMPTSLELHMPVVQPTRCTRTEEVEPRQQRALGEVMMRTYVEVMVERL
jgi:hypothetical protein